MALDVQSFGSPVEAIVSGADTWGSISSHHVDKDLMLKAAEAVHGFLKDIGQDDNLIGHAALALSTGAGMSDSAWGLGQAYDGLKKGSFQWISGVKNMGFTVGLLGHSIGAAEYLFKDYVSHLTTLNDMAGKRMVNAACVLVAGGRIAEIYQGYAAKRA